jgi:hypothetical protein
MMTHRQKPPRQRDYGRKVITAAAGNRNGRASVGHNLGSGRRGPRPIGWQQPAGGARAPGSRGAPLTGAFGPGGRLR